MKSHKLLSRASQVLLLLPLTILFAALLAPPLVDPFVRAEQSNIHQTVFDDEEIVVAPSRDYERTSVDHHHAEAQIAREIASVSDDAEQRMQSASMTYEENDPFAATFEDNDILPDIDISNLVSSSSHSNSADTKSHPQNEPFYRPGPWSECFGAPCGQLGKRTRKLECRLYLSRSSRFTELPDSSCHSAFVPDTQEPCYMDCVPDTDKVSGKDESDIGSINEQDNTDEVVYDLELTRYVWRTDSWTKCSAECLGGQHERIIECWDKVAESLVNPSLCDQSSRPQIVVGVCNNVPCPPEWKVDEFSKCSRHCGSAGVKTRSVACVQQVPLSEGGSSSLLVSNDLCLQTNLTMPTKVEPCNRVDCAPEWKVGPWSNCSKPCGNGIRNRSVICEQEFADKDGPKRDMTQERISPDLIEAITLSSQNWYPGKATQVPFHECFKEYRTVPILDERCFEFCEEESLIDADRDQNYQVQDGLRRKTISLKVGGKATVLEGKNIKIKCKFLNQHGNLVRPKLSDHVDWHKDGVKIFVNGTKVAGKQYISMEEDTIFGNDLIGDDRSQYMADDPNLKRSVSKTSVSLHIPRTRQRNLRVRSSNTESMGNFQFVSQRGGRFSLVKDNALRIKRLRLDDTGSYTCSYGSVRETLDLRVVSLSSLIDNEEKYIGL